MKNLPDNYKNLQEYRVGMNVFRGVHLDLLERVQGTGRFLGLGGLFDSLDFTLKAIYIFNQYVEDEKLKYNKGLYRMRNNHG
ncbi:MAG: hypothetical protein HY376_01900 [Candidatus Blackburnbacteria bacterium]|nr:hypothetical protein [Candidatus Blackburnbacteria bacterium]